MMYDLIEVKPKINKKKVIVLSIIVVILLLLLIVLIMHHYKNNNYSKKQELNNNIGIADNNKIKKQHKVNINMIPNFTENTIEQINNIYHQDTEKTVYLTFDDGPSKSVTPLILDLLKQENIKATFFVLGSRAELNPDILKREYAEGHFIANHGYSHIYKNIYANPEAVLEEYNKTRDVVKNILGNNYEGHLFRFPGGIPGGKYKEVKAEAKILLEQNQIASIDWNALSSDAAGAKTKEALMESIINTVGDKNTVVILMHDAGDKILTYETLPDVIKYLREQGYNFKNFYSIMK